jgi:tetratricopeptide (TPR) repeat protein
MTSPITARYSRLAIAFGSSLGAAARRRRDNRRMSTVIPAVLCIVAVLLPPARASAQPGRGQGPGADQIRQGVQLDLEGKYAEARQLFKQAIDGAATPQAKAPGIRAMAMSFAFENDCSGATPYSMQLYDMYLAATDFYNAGEMVNELARVCIEAGDVDAAEKLYRMGREAGLREPNISPARRDLWEFRTEHALARLAIRRGNKAEAQQHVDAAKAILDRGTNADQAIFFPYLTGYVALYGGDYTAAVAELQKANQRDPFILCLLGQAYEKLGNAARAKDAYARALSVSNAHNPPAAFARPFAKRRLAQLQ